MVQRNPQARREFVDTLTGARTRAGAPGARPSGRLVTRVRPTPERPLETVVVDPDDLAPERDTFGIDPGATEGLRRAAARVSARKPGKALARDAELDLGRAGASTTFNSPKAAADLFMRNNPAIFDQAVFESADLFDATKDFMDGVEVRQGKRFVRLSRTPRGEEILAGGIGGAIARDMLAYLFGQAGKHRRWRDVPWSMVDSYVERVTNVMQDEAQRQGVVAPAGGVEWYPLSSGVYPPEQVVTLAVDELGEAKAQRLADWLNSQSLYDLADRLADVLHPPKGSAGKRARRAKKCLGKADRATVRRRVALLRQWAAHPDEVPTWACVATRETESTAVPVCMFPALEDEVRRTMAACDVPYDPNWPLAEHAIRCARGEADESGLPPAPCPDDARESYDEPIDDVPWENPASHLRPATVEEVEEARSWEGANTTYDTDDFDWWFGSLPTRDFIRPNALYGETGSSIWSKKDWKSWLSEERDHGGSGFMDALKERFPGNSENDPIVVTYRSGAISIEDGWHRTAIAVANGMPEIFAIIGTPKKGRDNPDDDYEDDEDLSDAPESYRKFSEWIRALKARKKEFIAEHREIFERDGIVTAPGYDGRYTLVLTRGTTSPYRVTDFLGDDPVGHSERDTLDEALAVLWDDATAEYRRSPPQPSARARNPAPSAGRAARAARRIANV